MSQFRRAIDKVLQSNPTGRISDTTALMAKTRSCKVSQAHSFPNKAISTQGSALIVPLNKPNPHTKSSKQNTAPRTPHLQPTLCTWCVSADKVFRYDHLSFNCSRDPNRVLNPAPKITRPPSNTSTRLHALITQVDIATSAKDSQRLYRFYGQAPDDNLRQKRLKGSDVLLNIRNRTYIITELITAK